MCAWWAAECISIVESVESGGSFGRQAHHRCWLWAVVEVEVEVVGMAFQGDCHGIAFVCELIRGDSVSVR